MDKSIIKAIIFSVLIVSISAIIVFIQNRPILKKMNKDDIVFNEKANIYLFWGDGCPHCEDLAKFLNKNYKNEINLYSFEVWYNDENYEMMQKFATQLAEKTNGVPYLIIGNESFTGYVSESDTKIKDVIDKYIINNSYDVYKKINEFDK